LLKNIKQK